MIIFHIIIGLVLLMLGRKLFWAFVAFSGFMVGIQFSEMLMPYYSQWIQVAVALGVGIVGALLAILVQRIAFVLAGFLAGLYMVFMATQSFGYSGISFLLFLFGGAAGAMAGYLFIDDAIIVFSALIGAGVIVSGIAGACWLAPAIRVGLFLVLSMIGIWIQMRSMAGMEENKRTR